MQSNIIVSSLVNTWKGIGFWTGFSLRQRMIGALKPAKESAITNLILGLCVIVSALVPFTAGYELIRTAPMFREQESAISFSTALLFVAVIILSFYWRVFVWPRRQRPAEETAQRFAGGTYAMLASSGRARWILIGTSLAQAVVTVAAIAYVKQHAIGGSLVIYLSVWLPAAGALAVAIATAKSFHAGDTSFSESEKALMGMQVSTNLTVVAFILAGLVVYAASLIIALAVFIVGGLILWRAFASRTDPANTEGLFEPAKEPASRQWRDASGSTHIDGEGHIRQTHSGALLGKVDADGRVTDTDGTFRGSVGGDGRVR